MLCIIAELALLINKIVVIALLSQQLFQFFYIGANISVPGVVFLSIGNIVLFVFTSRTTLYWDNQG